MTVTDSGAGSSNAPRRVVVKEVLQARYRPGSKPLSWDKRTPGIEKILTASGETVLLYSGGGQSSPETGWELLLVGPARAADLAELTRVSAAGAASDAASQVAVSPVSWTLYGIKRPETVGAPA